MEFLNIQILIFFSVMALSLVVGKKGTVAAVVIWIIQTISIYGDISYGYIQIITLGVSFQIGLLIGIIRDFIIQKINLRKKAQ